MKTPPNPLFKKRGGIKIKNPGDPRREIGILKFQK